MSDLDKCDPEVYATGTMVFMTHTIRAVNIEGWVRRVAFLSGQRVDWHYAGGRACVLALGNLEAVRDAIRTLMPEHDRLQIEAAEAINPGREHTPWSTIYEDNEINTAHEYARQMVLEREATRR